MTSEKKPLYDPKKQAERPDSEEDLGVPLEQAAERSGPTLARNEREEKSGIPVGSIPPAQSGSYQKTKKEPDEIGKKKRIEILKRFTQEVLKKHGPLVRSIVLFGSTARGTERGESDIDVFLILDDTRQRLTPSMRDKIEWEIEDIAKACSKHLSVQQPYTLTEFWRLVREGHPIVFNFIREGIPVYDKDIFLPIKRLLQMGEIRPSKEAVEKFIDRGPQRIKRVEDAKMYMIVEDLYYAMLESAQAVLMFLGKTPPRPIDAPEELRKTLLPMKLLEDKYIKDLEGILLIRKEVEHKRIKSITGLQLDKWIKTAEVFVKKMQSLIVKIEVLKRESMIEKSYAIMAETAATLLKTMGTDVPKSQPLRKVFEEQLVTSGKVQPQYLEVLQSLEKMRALVRKGKILDIPKSDILAQREYVRKFIHEAGRVIKKLQISDAGELEK